MIPGSYWISALAHRSARTRVARLSTRFPQRSNSPVAPTGITGFHQPRPPPLVVLRRWTLDRKGEGRGAGKVGPRVRRENLKESGPQIILYIGNTHQRHACLRIDKKGDDLAWKTYISELGCAHREHSMCTPCTLCTLCTPCAHRPSDSLRPKLCF